MREGDVDSGGHERLVHRGAGNPRAGRSIERPRDPVGRGAPGGDGPERPDPRGRRVRGDRRDRGSERDPEREQMSPLARKVPGGNEEPTVRDHRLPDDGLVVRGENCHRIVPFDASTAYSEWPPPTNTRPSA